MPPLNAEANKKIPRRPTAKKEGGGLKLKLYGDLVMKILPPPATAVKYPYSPLRAIKISRPGGQYKILVPATPVPLPPSPLAAAPILVNGSRLLDLQAVTV